MSIGKNLKMGILVLAITSCAKSGQSGAVNTSAVTNTLVSSGLAKTWVSTSNDQLTIGQDGTFSDSGCADQGSLSSVAPQADCPSGAVSCGTSVINLSHSNGASGCLAVGSATCAYVTWATGGTTYLTFDCGNGSMTYHAM